MIEHKPTGPVDRLNFSFSRVSMWMPALIVAVIFYEVVARYIFFKPTLWANELSLWIGGAIYVTSGLYAMQQRSHIRIFILYDMAPRWMRRLFDILSALCVCIFVFAVIWGGYGEAAAKFWRWETFGTAFDPPIPATNKSLILVTLSILALQAVSNLIRDWPAGPMIRKAFDIVVVLLVAGFAIAVLPALLAGETDGSRVPLAWRIALGLVLAIAVALSVWGLVRDFGVTPEPVVESHDPAEEVDLPDEVLSGRSPAVDTASGAPDDR